MKPIIIKVTCSAVKTLEHRVVVLVLFSRSIGTSTLIILNMIIRWILRAYPKGIHGQRETIHNVTSDDVSTSAERGPKRKTAAHSEVEAFPSQVCDVQ